MGCIQTRPRHKGSDVRSDTPPLMVPAQYSVDDYTETVKQALDRDDLDLVVRVLLSCNLDQRQEVRDRLHTDHISVPTTCRDQATTGTWPSWAGFAVELLLLSPWNGGATYLQRLLNDSIIREITIVETICSQDETNLQKIKESYSTEASARSLADELTAKCSPVVAEVLAGLLAERTADMTVNPHEYANDLIEASNQKALFEGKKLFFKMMNEVPLEDIKKILELFLKQSQRDISVEMEKYYEPGRALDGLKTVVSLLRNRPLHRATRLSELLKAPGDPANQLEMCYILLTAPQDQLHEIKQAYKNTYFEMLSRDVRSEVQDSQLQKALLLAVK